MQENEQPEIPDMVASFVDDAPVSDANLEFTLTKEELNKIKATFKPLQMEENVRFEFLGDQGLIIVSSQDQGIQSWVEISTTEMDLRNETYQVFFLDTKRITKLADSCNGSIAFTVEDGEMKAKIGSTDLHITLPMYELQIDVSHNMEQQEAKSSDEVNNITSRLQASKGAGNFILPVLQLGKDVRYGTTQNVSVVTGGLEKLEIKVKPDFLDYLSNITFTKEEVAFILGKDNDETPIMMVSSDNVFYKAPVEIQDFAPGFDELLAAEGDCSIKLDTSDVASKLAVLSIPLVGQDNATFTITAVEGGSALAIMVRDEGQRESFDSWPVKEPIKGSMEAEFGIASFLNTVNAQSKQDVLIESKENCILVKDGVSTNMVIKHM